MARPGRKRKDRLQAAEPRPRRDEGTPELQARRRWYAQQGDPVLTTYPLGILLANEAISEQEHRAACRYAWLNQIVYGRKSVAASRYDDAPRGMDDSENERWVAARKSDLRRVWEILGGDARMVRTVLDNIVVYERTPRFLLPTFPRPSDVVQGLALRRALELLTGRDCERALSEAA